MIRIEVIEGKGSYSGIARNKSYHTQGRLGAKVQAYKDDKLVYVSMNASTLPDSISDWYSYTFNDGSPIPCVMEGTYKVYSKYHKSTKALELGYGVETVPVIRSDQASTSSYINFHYCNANDPAYEATYASSTGCITMLKSELYEMFDALGITKFDGTYIGELVVKRSLSETLYDHYKGYYPKMIDKFATVKEDVEACDSIRTKVLEDLLEIDSLNDKIKSATSEIDTLITSIQSSLS